MSKDKVESIVAEINSALKLSDEGKDKKAEKIISKLKKKHPNNPDVEFGLGMLDLQKEELVPAATHFCEALKFDSKHIESLLKLCEVFLELSNLKGAVECLNRVIEQKDKDPDMANLAQKRMDGLKKKLWDEEKIDLDKFIQAQDSFEQGVNCMDLGEFEQAISHFEKSASLNSEVVEIYGNLGLCHAYLGNKQKALNYLDKSLEIFPDYQFALYNRPFIEALKDGEKLPIYQ